MVSFKESFKFRMPSDLNGNQQMCLFDSIKLSDAIVMLLIKGLVTSYFD